MPEQFLVKMKNYIKPEWWLAFFSAIIIGFLTHAYVFLNRLPNHDGMINIYNTQAKLVSGRFFLGPASGMSTFFDLPWVIGLLSILFLALSSVCVVILFNLKKKFSIIIVAGLIVVFPSVSSTFAYLYTADGYMLGILFTMLAIVLTREYKFGFLIGAILMGLAVGIYQANLSIAMAFITLYLIYCILFTSIQNKHLWQLVGRFGLMGTVGMSFYFVVYKLYTNVFGGAITNYQGLDKVGAVSLGDFPNKLPLIFQQLKGFFFYSYTTSNQFNFFEILNVVIFILIAIILPIWILKKQLYKKVSQMLALVILICTLPISYYILFFISPDVGYHMLMVFSISTTYIFLALYYEALDELKPAMFEKAMAWMVVFVLGLSIFNFSLIANISYFNMELRFEKSLNLGSRVLTRIEQLDDYKDIKKIAVSGRVPMKTKLAFEILPQSIPIMTGAMGDTVLTASYHYKSMLENFLGYRIDAASEEEMQAIYQTKEFEEMGEWPAKDSIRVFDDIVMIKFH